MVWGFSIIDACRKFCHRLHRQCLPRKIWPCGKNIRFCMLMKKFYIFGGEKLGQKSCLRRKRTNMKCVCPVNCILGDYVTTASCSAGSPKLCSKDADLLADPLSQASLLDILILIFVDRYSITCLILDQWRLYLRFGFAPAPSSNVIASLFLFLTWVSKG